MVKTRKRGVPRVLLESTEEEEFEGFDAEALAESCQALDEVRANLSDDDEEDLFSSGPDESDGDEFTSDSSGSESTSDSEPRVRVKAKRQLHMSHVPSTSAAQTLPRQQPCPPVQTPSPQTSPSHKDNYGWSSAESSTKFYGFRGHTGIQNGLTHEATVSDAVSSFVDNSILDTIAYETNRYARKKELEKRKKKKKDKSHSTPWTETNRDEIKVMLALIVLMGIIQLPEIRAYWKTDSKFDLPYFKDAMPRDRFLSLLAYLHFVDNDDEEPDDSLRKIRPLLDAINENCQAAYVPEQDISIDESLFKFKGRLRIKTYNAQKRARFGFKVYKLCAAKGGAPGYTWKFRVYDGAHEDPEDMSKTTNLVMEMMDGLLGQGRTVVMDNYYNSPELFSLLYQQRTNAYGTVKLNRKGMPERKIPATPKKTKRNPNPKSPKQDFIPFGQKKLAPGEIEYRTNADGFLAMIWMDKKPVKMLSTFHKPSFVDVRKRKRGEVTVKRKPRVVDDYNTRMGGVDRSDQFATSHKCARRSAKYYKKLFLYIFDMCLVNAYLVFKLLHRQDDQAEITYLQFRMKWIDKVMLDCHQNIPEQKLRSRLVSGVQPMRLSGRHFPVPIPQPADAKRKIYRRCVVCSSRGARKESRFMCDVCEVALCTECFKDYHTKVDYSII